MPTVKKKTMDLQIENKQKMVKIDRRQIRSTVAKLLKYINCLDREISLSFVDDAFIQLLNNQYLNKNRPTNVLSFSLQEGEFGNINPRVLGDIVISVDTAQRDADEKNISLENEINFLIIHGLLHLLGYDHEKTAEEKNKMRQKEKELINLLKDPDFDSFRLAASRKYSKEWR